MARGTKQLSNPHTAGREGWIEYLTLGIPLIAYFLILVAFPGSVIAKFTAGIFALVVIPGYLLGKTLHLWESGASVVGFSLILGLLVQLLNAFAVYVTDTLVRLNHIDFSLYTVLATGVETALLIHFARPVTTTLPAVGNLLHPLKNVLVSVSGIFLISLAGNLYFQGFNQTAILPDGALYLDISRYIVSKGSFSSLIVDAVPYAYQNQAGLTVHIGTALLYSFFFSIGDVSYQVAKWGASLIGALLVYPVFEVTLLSFGRKAGLISAAIIAAHPLFRYYSAILYGPEIASALLALISLLLIQRALDSRSLHYSILSGAVVFLSSLVWLGDIVPLVGAVALIFTLASRKKDRGHRELLMQSLAPTLLFGACLIALLSSSNVQLWLASLTVICGLLVSYRYLKIDNLMSLTAVSFVFLMLTQLYLLRFYLFPGALVYPSAVINAPSQPYITGDVYAIAGRFIDYVWPNWYASSLPIILITALLSIIWVTRRALVPYSFFIAWLFARLTILPTQAGLLVVIGERFYLSITLVFIIFSGGFFSRVASIAPRYVGNSVGKRFTGLSRTFPDSGIRTVVLAAFVVALIIGSSLQAYSNYIGTFSTNSVEANGWSPVLDWIHINTNGRDILLTTGSPRVWAWFTDREVVGTSVVMNNALLPEDQIGPPEFSHLISQFSPTYVIFDSSFQAALMFLPKLSYLYGNFQPGTTLSLNSTSGSVILEVIISSMSTVNNGTVTLYRIMK